MRVVLAAGGVPQCGQCCKLVFAPSGIRGLVLCGVMQMKASLNHAEATEECSLLFLDGFSLFLFPTELHHRAQMVWHSIKMLKSLPLSACIFNMHKLIQDLPIAVANTQNLN